MPKQSTAVHPATAWIDLLKHKRPELLTHKSLNYAIECVIAEACRLPHPLPPQARIQQGAENRGKAISKAATSRKNGSKPKSK